MENVNGLDRSKYSGITATPGTILLKVEARHLHIGDILVATHGTVTHAPSCGISTPRGKVDLGVNGFRKTWNKTTEILIERKG